MSLLSCAILASELVQWVLEPLSGSFGMPLNDLLVKAATSLIVLTPLLIWGVNQSFKHLATRGESMQFDRDLFKRLAMVAEFTTNAAILTDCKGNIVWVNAGFTRITGYSLDEVLGKVIGSFLHCEQTDKQTVENLLAACATYTVFKVSC